MATLTRKEPGPDFKAKHDGRCRGCRRRITAGYDFVCHVEGVRNERGEGLAIFHSHCARGYCATVNEHLEEGE